MRIGLLTEGGYPYATGETGLWCERLVHGLGQHQFDLYTLAGTGTPRPLPPNARVARTAGRDGLSGPDTGPARTLLERTAFGDHRTARRAYGRRDRRRFTEAFHRLAVGLCAEDAPTSAGPDTASPAPDPTDAFAEGLYALAELARERGGLPGALRSDDAVRTLEAACRAPGARRGAADAGLPDHLAFADHLERTLRPLSLDWYEEDALGAADLCHAAAGGTTALPGLLAKRFFGTPLLVTEYGVQLRSHYLSTAADRSTPLRTLLAALHGRLAAETYRQAALLTPGNAHARRWQEKCGADRARIRTVHPGMAADRFAEVGEDEESGDPATLIWVGRVEPAKDLIALLHAFAEIRARQPDTRLRIVAVPTADPGAGAYLAHCKGLAAQLFPDEAAGAHAVGENPVCFEELGGPEAPTLEDAYASGAVVVLSSIVEGFPASLVEAMFCARATVSTDVGAVVEIIGGTGLVVPPRNPRALADACLALLRDPERRYRLGAAARARALELFTVEQNLAAFRGIYLELLSHAPVRHRPGDGVPFAHPAESHVPGSWAHKAVSAGTGAPDA
ncbi:MULTISPECIES: glycosyltransferase [Streptomyces]|uniref:D-inositol 3-phosphate glycosyltransferase n=1 Tax=Streptomyces venezuelae (strain ATCC 10712 / CBS 650.69 / DSM 40230 / JCM 4526 / NBRC 13096 / PD 04745) TaxID=953739 RepID=F2R1L9_STRVP|nr:glycosyltransferase [Streptomyces venezuelae]APE23760.1 transferase [Streptomyces venezuelae]QES01132.1 glycosyltransferase [Streptomyces venezuelae ATCC 10712]CCA58110.1 transferase [Streptomyces venezuelae ATCC 10712]